MEYYKNFFKNREYRILFSGAVFFLLFSLIIQYKTSFYVTRSISEPVTDIILSNTRVYDVGLIFVYGALILTLFATFIGFRQINYAPFVMKSIALFTLIRSFFVSLTHISPFPTRVVIESSIFTHPWFSGIFTGNDLFFSGHTGVPFLLALIFWENKNLRTIFLGFSILFAAVVLLGHLHYSIDVASAYFITYTIFHLCKFLFKKDWKLFTEK